MVVREFLKDEFQAFFDAKQEYYFQKVDTLKVSAFLLRQILKKMQKLYLIRFDKATSL